jgi:hypothetical protein
VLWRDLDCAPHSGQKVGCRLSTVTVHARSRRSTPTTFKPAPGDHVIDVFIAPCCRIPSQGASRPASSGASHPASLAPRVNQTLITTAATLNAHGVTDIQTSSQAADALRPIAGRFAFTVFALGIIGTGMLALPVLAGSAAYALGETVQWRVGLAQRPGRAPAFYVTIAAATLVGAALNFTPLDPVKALIWSAIINGVAAVPIMAMIMLMASRESVMGKFVLTKPLAILGWLATAVMAAAAIGMFATWGS